MPKSHLTKTRLVTAYVSMIMLTNMLWYHVVVPSYYILYLHGREMKQDTKYFSIVYYITGVLDEFTFSLLIVMASIIHNFSGGRRWSKTSSRNMSSSPTSSPNKIRRSNSAESKAPSLHLMTDDLLEDKIGYFKAR